MKAMDENITFLKSIGFANSVITRMDSGYVIDGDMCLTDRDVKRLMQKQARVGTSFFPFTGEPDQHQGLG
jgi:hypothetical protein